MQLTQNHKTQIAQIAEHTGDAWGVALEHALSEYRSNLGLLPPNEPSSTLDDLLAVEPAAPTCAAPLLQQT